jgi:hypothetical protein
MACVSPCSRYESPYAGIADHDIQAILRHSNIAVTQASYIKSVSEVQINARRKPFTVPAIFAPIFVPLLFLAWALSFPWAHILKLAERRQERRSAEQMKKAGRLMQWQEFKQAVANGTGTAIGEYLSTKGSPLSLIACCRRI